jgi:hypothetical protein
MTGDTMVDKPKGFKSEISQLKDDSIKRGYIHTHHLALLLASSLEIFELNDILKTLEIRRSLFPKLANPTPFGIRYQKWHSIIRRLTTGQNVLPGINAFHPHGGHGYLPLHYLNDNTGKLIAYTDEDRNKQSLDGWGYVKLADIETWFVDEKIPLTNLLFEKRTNNNYEHGKFSFGDDIKANQLNSRKNTEKAPDSANTQLHLKWLSGADLKNRWQTTLDANIFDAIMDGLPVYQKNGHQKNRVTALSDSPNSLEKWYAANTGIIDTLMFKVEDIKNYEAKNSEDKSMPKDADLKWGGITATFLTETEILFQYGGTSTEKDFTQLGFADGRNGKPRKSWNCFLEASTNDCQILYSLANRAAVEKDVEFIRKKLRERFPEVGGDPIPHKSGCYKFEIHLKNSFAEK